VVPNVAVAPAIEEATVDVEGVMIRLFHRTPKRTWFLNAGWGRKCLVTVIQRLDEKKG
jgi:hypothetical protein